MRLVKKYYLKCLWHKYKVSNKNRSIVLAYPPLEAWVESTNPCNLLRVMCLRAKS